MSTSSKAPVALGVVVQVSAPRRKRVCQRRISPQAGRALEILGHAIEYLADEYMHNAGRLCAHDGQVEAVRLLMRLNRQVYFECPEAPTMADRWRALFRPRTA
jgi:hypothetical protein